MTHNPCHGSPPNPLPFSRLPTRGRARQPADITWWPWTRWARRGYPRPRYGSSASGRSSTGRSPGSGTSKQACKNGFSLHGVAVPRWGNPRQHMVLKVVAQHTKEVLARGMAPPAGFLAEHVQHAWSGGIRRVFAGLLSRKEQTLAALDRGMASCSTCEWAAHTQTGAVHTQPARPDILLARRIRGRRRHY